MGKKIYAILPYAIVLTLIMVIAGQVYWNYKNYQNSLREMHIDLQESFNTSVERYLTLRAEESRIDLDNLENLRKVIQRRMNRGRQNVIYTDSLSGKGTKLMGVLQEFSTYNKEHSGKDSVRSSVSTISVTISEEDLSLERLDSVLSLDLKKKNLDPQYGLMYIQHQDTLSLQGNTNFENGITASAGMLKKTDKLVLKYDGLENGAISRGLGGLIISTFLVIVVAIALLYLYRIIRRQKQLDEMKNDLISNITHEFKTPLATAAAAVEGVQSFTGESERDKREKYLNITQEQLAKLNLMVEKLLETAAINREGLNLHREPIELDQMLNELAHKFSGLSDKQLNLETSSISLTADPIHLENALANLIDNAIKYGGEKIMINTQAQNNQVHIKIQDDGSNLVKADRERIFEKFYRAGSGNRHDVKGHGLGLYYTRAVIEKHGGSIILSSLDPTIFVINLPL